MTIRMACRLISAARRLARYMALSPSWDLSGEARSTPLRRRVVLDTRARIAHVQNGESENYDEQDDANGASIPEVEVLEGLVIQVESWHHGGRPWAALRQDEDIGVVLQAADHRQDQHQPDLPENER